MVERDVTQYMGCRIELQMDSIGMFYAICQNPCDVGEFQTQRVKNRESVIAQAKAEIDARLAGYAQGNRHNELLSE